MAEAREATRFAPSPSGRLHVGHVLAAVEARRLADELGGLCRLRIEDIDLQRCRPEYAEALLDDLAWLGLRFDGEVMVQSRRMEIYRQALELLKGMGVLYPCFCTRKEIAERMAEMPRAPHGTACDAYTGTCRAMGQGEREARLAAGEAHAWRLDCRRVQDVTGSLEWLDLNEGRQVCEPSRLGDVILARKDFPVSYHLAVTVDDAAQGITHVTRGMDLFESTHVHRVLQALLGLPVPVWKHHGLLCDEYGRRLAKRDGARSLESLRSAGMEPGRLLASIEQALARGGVWKME